MIEIYCKTPQDPSFTKIDDFHPGSWVYAKEATVEDLNKIVELTGLDMADLRDSLDKYELHSIESINENVLFFIRHPSDRELGLYTETLTLVLTNHFVIAISPSRSETIESLIASNTTLGTSQKSKLILHILLKITQDYTNNIKKLRHSTLGYEMTSQIINSDVIAILTKNEEILNQ